MYDRQQRAFLWTPRAERDEADDPAPDRLTREGPSLIICSALQRSARGSARGRSGIARFLSPKRIDAGLGEPGGRVMSSSEGAVESVLPEHVAPRSSASSGSKLRVLPSAYVRESANRKPWRLIPAVAREEPPPAGRNRIADRARDYHQHQPGPMNDSVR